MTIAILAFYVGVLAAFVSESAQAQQACENIASASTMTRSQFLVPDHSGRVAVTRLSKLDQNKNGAPVWLLQNGKCYKVPKNFLVGNRVYFVANNRKVDTAVNEYNFAAVQVIKETFEKQEGWIVLNRNFSEVWRPVENPDNRSAPPVKDAWFGGTNKENKESLNRFNVLHRGHTDFSPIEFNKSIGALWHSGVHGGQRETYDNDTIEWSSIAIDDIEYKNFLVSNRLYGFRLGHSQEGKAVNFNVYNTGTGRFKVKVKSTMGLSFGGSFVFVVD